MKNIIDNLFFNAIQNIQIGNFEAAEKNLSQLLNLQKKNLEARSLYGIVLASQGKFESAKKTLIEVIKKNPADQSARFNLANIQKEMEDIEGAEENYKKILDVNPNSINTLINYGEILFIKGEYEELNKTMDRVLEIQANNIQAIKNKINALINLKKIDEAKEAIKKLSSHQGNEESALELEIKILLLSNLHEDALKRNELLLRKNKNNVIAINNYGIIKNNYGEKEAAEEAYRRAISLRPNYFEAKINLGCLLLEKKLFEEGWELYESRTKINGSWVEKNIERWVGEKTDEEVLVWSEQGLGDQILFLSLMKDLLKINSNISLSLDKRIVDLLKKSFPNMKIYSQETINYSKYKLQIPLTSLGNILRKRESDFIHNQNPYICVEDNIVKQMKEKYKKQKKLCGISWKSSNTNFGDSKSLKLDQLKILVDSLDFDIINLQYSVSEKEKNYIDKHFKNKIIFTDINNYDDIDSLASLIASCDYVVTTSNTTAHISGAIGKKTKLMVPKYLGKFWYWHEINGKSLWYPNTKIYTQDSDGNWSNCIEKIISDFSSNE